MKDAGDWYEVYQDDIELWDFATFKKAFICQFIGELHKDDVMEELRDRYQWLKEKVAPYLTKFRRIIAHLKRPPAVREQINLAYLHLRPECQAYLWDKRLDSFDAIERYGREFERREAIKERYHFPPRRDKARFPGTSYAGPHRSSHKVVAAEESSSESDSGQPEKRKEKGKKGRSRESFEEVAVLNNVTSIGQQNERVQRGAPAQGNRRSGNQSSGARPSAAETPRQMLTSQPAPYLMLTSNLPMVSSGTAFVGPCSICQLVGHRAADCPTRAGRKAT